VLALDYSEARSRPLPTTAAMTTATITPLMLVHPRRLFGIGAMPIRVTTLRYPNARFRGDKLFNNQVGKPRPLRDWREAGIGPSE
jgi:hypothetical protein